MIEKLKVNTCIVGTGVAGYNAASRLKSMGVDDILLISENRLGGTSRNTGSDKQTYYKLTLSGAEPDSVVRMAQTLFDGKAVDGDVALCEAALSTRCFLHLAELGLPFPVNRYGEYVGYKTDHDPAARATSIGPYTSREMTRVLEKESQDLRVPFRNHLQVISVLSDGRKCYGLLCLDTGSDENRLVAIEATNVIYATGGPAGMFADSVYPESQHGASGIAFEAGVKGRNLTEWQFGLASLHPRWNVSGTYMQALPRFVSTDENGDDCREFLADYFNSPEQMLSMVFLKGYQWPFDVRKFNGGSSLIDVLVFMETRKGRRVFLDFTRDPAGGEFSFDGLSEEAKSYMLNAGAAVKLPIERLRIMNQPAIDFYKDKGVDLEKEMLEIALCAQHNNGGLEIDCWWHSNLEGFFPVGEVAGDHGVYRPGGSALNVSQVGSVRAATYISKLRKMDQDDEAFERELERSLASAMKIVSCCRSDCSNVDELQKKTTTLMSRCCAVVRDAELIGGFLSEVDSILSSFCSSVRYSEPSQLKRVFRLRDNLIAQKCFAQSMLDYVLQGGKSRGSAICHDNGGIHPYGFLPPEFTYFLDDGSKDSLVQEMSYKDGKCSFNWRKVRPIPHEDDFFENVWRSFRKNGNVS